MTMGLQTCALGQADLRVLSLPSRPNGDILGCRLVRSHSVQRWQKSACWGQHLAAAEAGKRAATAALGAVRRFGPRDQRPVLLQI